MRAAAFKGKRGKEKKFFLLPQVKHATAKKECSSFFIDIFSADFSKKGGKGKMCWECWLIISPTLFSSSSASLHDDPPFPLSFSPFPPPNTNKHTREKVISTSCKGGEKKNINYSHRGSGMFSSLLLTSFPI